MDIDVFCGRAETYEKHADVVTLRAVERFEAVLPIAISKVEANGRLALLIGQSQIAGARRLAPKLHWDDPIVVPESSNRVILVGRT